MGKRFKGLSRIFAVAMSFTLMAGCTNNPAGATAAQASSGAAASTAAATAAAAQDPQYLSREEVKYMITAIHDDYVLLDVRKAADYVIGHIINAVSADLDSAVSNQNDGPAIDNLKAALLKATGKADGGDKKLVLLCYSGNRYAQNGTRLLQGLGIPNSRIFTLKGGYKAWTEKDTTGEFQYLIDAVALAAKSDKPNTFTVSLFPTPRTGDVYFTPQEVKGFLDAKAIGSYYVIDTRTAAEYEDGHVVTAHNAPDFTAPKVNTFLPRGVVTDNVKAMFAKYPYEQGKKIIIVCRGGKGGAQNMDDILRQEFGISNDLIYTMQYGFMAFPESWTKLGADYEKYVVKGTEPGTVQ